uniref:RCHY1 zinc-ribbon domain-containing protein n=2 Tax=Aegilops tauschii TaxID=37682 RepID=A0A453D9X1_AEGTS
MPIEKCQFHFDLFGLHAVEVYFGMLDAFLAAEELPKEYRNRCQDILCNDRERKGRSQFHW